MEGYRLVNIQITKGEVGYHVNAAYYKKATEVNASGYFSSDHESKNYSFATLEEALNQATALFEPETSGDTTPITPVATEPAQTPSAIA